MKRYFVTLLILLLVISSISTASADNIPETTDTAEPSSETAEILTATEAEENTEEDSPNTNGMCGETLTWSFTAGINVLEISGYGAMYDYTYSEPAPWTPYREQIKEVRLLGGNDQGAITSIGDYAFAYCQALEKVIMIGGQKEIEHVGNLAFYMCESLSDGSGSLTVALSDNATFGARAFSQSGLETFSIPIGTTEISPGMFEDCSSLEHVYGCDSVVCIGKNAFSGCKSLVTFDVPQGVTEIKESTFMGCSSLKSIRTETSNLVSIDTHAFYGCRNLEKFYMPGSLRSIGTHAFSGNKNLKDVIINRTIQEIPEYAFENCTSLDRVHIPFNVRKIQKGAFKGCTNLKTVCIDDGVEEIKESAFAKCGIETLFFPPTMSVVEENAFNHTPLKSICVFSKNCNISGNFCGENDTSDLIVWAIIKSNVQKDLSQYNIKTGTISSISPNIEENAYYATPANYIYFRGFEGWDKSCYDEPFNNKMSRAMMVVMLWKLDGSKTVDESLSPCFEDVPSDAYYKKAVDWAYNAGITTGTSKTTFSPNNTITREQAVTMLYRFAQYVNADTTARADLANYVDKRAIAKYAVVPMQWAVANKIVKGITPTMLSPKRINLRSEAVTIMHRFLCAIKPAQE